MSRGSGREGKALDDQGRYTKSVSFRLNVDQWHQLRELAHKDGAKMYEWAKAAVLAAIEDAQPQEAEADDDAGVPEHLLQPVDLRPVTDDSMSAPTCFFVSDVFLGGTIYAKKIPSGLGVKVFHHCCNVERVPSLVFDTLEDALPVIRATAHARSLEEAAPYGLIVQREQLKSPGLKRPGFLVDAEAPSKIYAS